MLNMVIYRKFSLIIWFS